MDLQAMTRWNNLSASEIAALKEMSERIERSEQKIPIREVAAAAYTSTASIVRLAKKLGFAGYTDLLYAMRGAASAGVVRAEGAMGTLIDAHSLAVADELADDLSSPSFARVHVVGLGYSEIVGHYLVDKLQEMDIFATAKSPLDFAFDTSALLLLISKSGETHDLLFIKRRATALGIRVYVVTAAPQSSLAEREKRVIAVRDGREWGGRSPDLFAGNCLILFESILLKMKETREERTS